MKLNLKDLSIAYGAASLAAVTTGYVAGLLWSHIGGDTDYGLIVGSTWLFTVGVPSVLVSMDTLRKRLGQERPNTITAIGRQHRRGIPFSHNGRQSHVFLSMLPIVGHNFDPDPGPDLPMIFTATIDDNDYSVTVDELEQFVRTAWKRQRQGESPFSRPYFTRQHRPRLKPGEYYARINILSSCNGLVLDRAKSRSGRLSVSPGLAIKALQAQFSLV